MKILLCWKTAKFNFCFFSYRIVDPVDAPGYYKVIKTPMDFGTIRVKLEVSPPIFGIISYVPSTLTLTMTFTSKYKWLARDLWRQFLSVVVFLVYDGVKNPAALIHHVMFQTGKYQEYTEFHADMLLVKANCLKYNPPGHEIHQVSVTTWLLCSPLNMY